MDPLFGFLLDCRVIIVLDLFQNDLYFCTVDEEYIVLPTLSGGIAKRPFERKSVPHENRGTVM